MENETATNVCTNDTIILLNDSPVVFFTEYRNLTGASSVKYKFLTGVPQTLFSENGTIVSDFQVLKTDTGDLIAIWKQVEMALPDKHRIFFGNIDSDFKLTSKNEITTAPKNIKFHTLRGAVLGEFLAISAYDTTSEKFMVISHNYNTNNFPETIYYLPDNPSNEFKDLRHSLITNIQMLINGENILLQANIENQVLRTWQLNINDDGSLVVDILFDFADSNLGFHRTIINDDGDFMLITFSGANKDTTVNNDIFIVKQPLFSDKDIYTLQALPINQTHGYYIRPEIVQKDNYYWLLWEGSRIHYTAINSDLNITVPENTIDTDKPGNILSTVSDEIIISNTSNKLPILNAGLSIEMHIISMQY